MASGFFPSPFSTWARICFSLKQLAHGAAFGMLHHAFSTTILSQDVGTGLKRTQQRGEPEGGWTLWPLKKHAKPFRQSFCFWVWHFFFCWQVLVKTGWFSDASKRWSECKFKHPQNEPTDIANRIDILKCFHTLEKKWGTRWYWYVCHGPMDVKHSMFIGLTGEFLGILRAYTPTSTILNFEWVDLEE